MIITLSIIVLGLFLQAQRLRSGAQSFAALVLRPMNDLLYITFHLNNGLVNFINHPILTCIQGVVRKIREKLMRLQKSDFMFLTKKLLVTF
jgi:hypothetical protein